MRREDEPSDGDLAALAAAVNLLTSSVNAAYDGVLGPAPDCIPEFLAEAFYACRYRMLHDGHTADEIRGWMKSYRPPPSVPFGDLWAAAWPAEYENEIRTLVLVQQMSSDGKDLGLERLLSNEEYERMRAQGRSEHASKAAQHPRKSRAVSYQMDGLVRLVTEHPDITAKSLLELLEHEPKTYDDEVLDGAELRRQGDAMVVTNLTTRESVVIPANHLNVYLYRARQQLTR